MTDRLPTPDASKDNDAIATEPTVADEVTTAPTPSHLSANVAVERMVGQVLAGRYRVVRRLGTGGFGAVFEAEDTKIHKRVAVKVLVRDLVNDTATLVRFRQEAEAASQVGHENIIDITDFDHTEDGHYFMVMEFLEGSDLGSLLRSGQPLAIGRLLGIVVQVCRALGAAHAKGILHRDLKPANIFLTVRGSRPDFVKVLDFGISKFMEMDEKASRLTKTGQIVGTPLYMAPEQAIGEHAVDHRVDIYSLGIILYELLAGRPPFTASTYLGIIAAHTSEPPQPPSKARPDLLIPEVLERVVMRAIAKRPEDRFSSMADFETALLDAASRIDPALAVSHAGQLTPTSLPGAKTGWGQSARPKPRRALRLLLPAAVGAAISLAFFAGWLLLRKPAPVAASGSGSGSAGGGSAATLAAATHADAKSLTPASLPADEVEIRIRSTPPGAQILDSNGRTLDLVTPAVLRIQRGTAPLKLLIKKSGYALHVLAVDPGASRAFDITLKKRPRRSVPDEPKGWGEH